MGAIKLKKHGNSYGFTVPSAELRETNFSVSDEFEMLISINAISFIKRRAHNKNWKFEDTKLGKEDRKWLDANLGNIDE
jgi:antitoxin component of MazEF toxin-antitoxin module